MTRFVALSVPAALLLLALEAFAVDLTGLTGSSRLPLAVAAGGWLLEAVALVALFLLVQGRGGSWWVDGLLVGLIAWVFRGPLLVLAVVSRVGGPREPWWMLALGALVAYPACGLAIAALGRRLPR